MNLEQECTKVLAKHIGPAASSFLTRQCKYHIYKEPSALQKSDLDELAKWCYIGVSLTLDKTVAEKVKQEILAMK